MYRAKLHHLSATEKATLRPKDLRSLRFVIDAGRDVLDVDDMDRARDIMLELNRGQECMTGPQRAMIAAYCHEIDPEFNCDDDPRTPAERNAEVPEGKPVATPEVLKRLPLKPPGARGGWRDL